MKSRSFLLSMAACAVIAAVSAIVFYHAGNRNFAGAGAIPVPRPEPGGCPTNYQQSGNLCVPVSRNTRPCVERRGGTCPENFITAGNFCCRVGR